MSVHDTKGNKNIIFFIHSFWRPIYNTSSEVFNYHTDTAIVWLTSTVWIASYYRNWIKPFISDASRTVVNHAMVCMVNQQMFLSLLLFSLLWPSSSSTPAFGWCP